MHQTRRSRIPTFNSHENRPNMHIPKKTVAYAHMHHTRGSSAWIYVTPYSCEYVNVPLTHVDHVRPSCIRACTRKDGCVYTDVYTTHGSKLYVRVGHTALGYSYMYNTGWSHIDMRTTHRRTPLWKQYENGSIQPSSVHLSPLPLSTYWQFLVIRACSKVRLLGG